MLRHLDSTIDEFLSCNYLAFGEVNDRTIPFLLR